MSVTKKIKLKKVKDTVRKYLQLLVDDGFPVKQAYIFGSYARGDFKKESDIDLCRISPRFRRNWDKYEQYL